MEDYKIAPSLHFFGAINHHISSQSSRGLLLFITKSLETNETKQYAPINRNMFKDYLIVRMIHRG
jgi:hypothetical protein